MRASRHSALPRVAVLGALVSLAWIAPSAPARARTGPQVEPPPALTQAFANSRRHDAVLTDVDAAGNVWARGSNWKARFGRDGLDFRPVLGPDAPRNPTLSLDLLDARRGGVALAVDREAAARLEPAVAGHAPRVRFERGALTEMVDLRLDEIEQDFVFTASPGSGDLFVRLAVSTDLEFAGRDASGLVFAIPEELGAGSVHYGDVVVRDASGRAVHTPVEFDAGVLTLRAPAGFLADATYPVVLDPVVLAFGVDQTSAQDGPSDVAYDAGSDTWLFAYEESASGSDPDILTRRFSGAGAFLDEVAVDISNEFSRDPSVANNASTGRFLVVWHETGAALGQIRARSRLASGTSQFQNFVVTSAQPFFENDEMQRVGGTSSAGSANYLVVWRAVSTIGSSKLQARRVTDSATVGSTFDVADGGVTTPSISKSSGPHKAWMVAYEDDAVGGVKDVRAAVVEENGTLVTTGFPVATTTAVEVSPACAGDGLDFMVVWARTSSASNSDIQGARLRLAGNLANLSGTVNLSAIEPGVTLAVDQRDPGVAYDGGRFAYTYREGAAGAGNFDVFLATVFGDGQLTVQEGHVPVSPSAFDDQSPRIASRVDGGGVPGRYAMTWTRIFGATSSDVDGVIYDGTLGGSGFGVVHTGCGGAAQPPIKFLPGSSAVLGTDFGAQFIPAPLTTPLLLVGLPLALPFCSGQAPCVLGVNPLFTLPISAIVGTIPNVGVLAGFTIAIQGIEVNATSGPHCGPPFYTSSFHATDTLTVTFQ